MRGTSKSRYLFLLLVLLPVTAAAVAGESDNNIVSRELAVNESIKVTVVAKEKFNRVGVKVAAGQHYAFVVADGATWTDLNIVCDANGWLSKDAPAVTRKFIEKSEKNRRVPAANWFELVGTVGADEQHHFQIGLRGKDWTYTAPSDDELYLFANDLMRFYGNNKGSIEVIVTRRSEPGKHKLPLDPKSR